MSNALSLAGQSAANQVFTSSFWIISFLPSVTTPLVAKYWAAGEKEKVRLDEEQSDKRQQKHYITFLYT